HLAHDVGHAGQGLGGLVHDEIGALGHDLQLVVGDQGGDLDDHVAAGVEAGHLEVHPHEHAPEASGPPVAARRRAPWRARPGDNGAVLRVPVVRLDPDLPLPAYARAGDAGADLVARTGALLRRGGGRALVPTGLALALPDGYAGFV